MDFLKNVDILKKEVNFEYFTDLIKAKLTGSVVLRKPPKDADTELISFYDERITFDCPVCDRPIYTNKQSYIYIHVNVDMI